MTTEGREIFKNWREMQEKLLETWKNAAYSVQTASEQKEKESVTGLPLQSWQSFLKMQEQAFDGWKEVLSTFKPENAMGMFNPQQVMGMFNPQQVMGMFNPDRFTAYFQSGMPYSPQAFERLQQEWLKSPIDGMQAFMKHIPTDTGQKTFQKMMEMSGVYATLLNFWKELAPKIPSSYDAAKWQEFTQGSLESYTKVLESFFAACLPEPMRGMVKSPAEIAKLSQQSLFSFFVPWADAADKMPEHMAKLLGGDPGAYLDFMRAKQEAYQQSFGKMFKIPNVGPTLEHMEKINASVDSSMQYFTTMAEFSAVMYHAGIEAMEKLFKKYGDLVTENKAPDTFQEFYRLWWNTNEETFLEVFKTESFSQILAKVTGDAAQFKKHHDDFLTEVITNTLPIPTNREMDSVYKTVQQLKRFNREQNRQLEEIESKTDQLLARLEKLEKQKVKGETSQ